MRHCRIDINAAAKQTTSFRSLKAGRCSIYYTFINAGFRFSIRYMPRERGIYHILILVVLLKWYIWPFLTKGGQCSLVVWHLHLLLSFTKWQTIYIYIYILVGVWKWGINLCYSNAMDPIYMLWKLWKWLLHAPTRSGNIAANHIWNDATTQYMRVVITELQLKLRSNPP